MGHKEHKHLAPKSVGVALVTVSTSRDASQDQSGQVMAELMENAGHHVIDGRLIKDGIEPVRECLLDVAKVPGVQVIVFSGGTGISSQDLTLDAISPMVKTWLPGFGELFRRLSYDQIGTAAIMSRAEAAVCEIPERSEPLLVVALPGSPNAVRLAIEEVLLPELGHLVYEINR